MLLELRRISQYSVFRIQVTYIALKLKRHFLRNAIAEQTYSSTSFHKNRNLWSCIISVTMARQTPEREKYAIFTLHFEKTVSGTEKGRKYTSPKNSYSNQCYEIAYDEIFLDVLTREE